MIDLTAEFDKGEDIRSNPQGTEEAFRRCLRRLRALLDMETEALRSCARIDFNEFNRTKALLMLEFVRLSRVLSPSELSNVKSSLEDIGGCLSENARLLKLHLSATLEITEITMKSVAPEDSDGTYSFLTSIRREG